MSIIQVNDLRKRFGELEAVKGVSFQVEEGEIFGFLGPNGAGKSTTIKILSTLLLPSQGKVLLNGYDVVRQPNEVRRSIGIVFQDPTLDDRLTAEENLWFHCMLYGVPARQAKQRIDEALAIVELSDRRNSIVRTFSGGMKRRLEIARGLLHAPRVLFLDEPTVGLDPQTRNRIWEYIHDLRNREGLAIFMTTHYLDEAEHCDRIGIIDHGELIALDTPGELKRQLGGDVLTITSQQPARLAEAIRERFGGPVQLAEDNRVITERTDGASFVPQIAAAFPEWVDSISVRQPTLDDVFLKLTGRAIREESASAVDQMRAWRRR